MVKFYHTILGCEQISTVLDNDTENSSIALEYEITEQESSDYLITTK
jgi:hypothetical protein